MKVFHFIITALITYAFLSSGIYLTRSYDNARVRITQERQLAVAIYEIRKARRIKEEKIYNARVQKIVKDIRKINKNIDQKTAKQIAEAFIKYGKEYRIRINKLLQIASIESRFNHKAINKRSGDYGLMQINWKVWGHQLASRPKELLNIDTNVKSACYILRYNKRMGFERIGHYHSLNSDVADIYEEKLELFANKFAWNY